MARISALSAKTLTDTRHTGERKNTKNAVVCLMCLARVLRELRAAAELGRSAYGFEIDRNFYERAKNKMLVFEKDSQMNISDFIGDTV